MSDSLEDFFPEGTEDALGSGSRAALKHVQSALDVDGGMSSENANEAKRLTGDAYKRLEKFLGEPGRMIEVKKVMVAVTDSNEATLWVARKNEKAFRDGQRMEEGSETVVRNLKTKLREKDAELKELKNELKIGSNQTRMLVSPGEHLMEGYMAMPEGSGARMYYVLVGTTILEFNKREDTGGSLSEMAIPLEGASCVRVEGKRITIVYSNDKPFEDVVFEVQDDEERGRWQEELGKFVGKRLEWVFVEGDKSV